MTPQQAHAGLVELILPNGGQVLVGFGEKASTNPDIEASVVRTMLAVRGTENDVRAALADFAEESGLTAVVSLERGSMTVVIS